MEEKKLVVSIDDVDEIELSNEAYDQAEVVINDGMRRTTPKVAVTRGRFASAKVPVTFVSKSGEDIHAGVKFCEKCRFPMFEEDGWTKCPLCEHEVVREEIDDGALE